MKDHDAELKRNLLRKHAARFDVAYGAGDMETAFEMALYVRDLADSLRLHTAQKIEEAPRPMILARFPGQF